MDKQAIMGVRQDLENINGTNGIHILGYIPLAEELVNIGYRKIPENGVVLTREEHELLTNDLDKTDYGDFENGYRQGYQQGSKDTAEKFAEKLKEKLNEWLEDNEDNDGKIGFGIAEIELIGVKSLESEVISESLIDEICKEITEGEKEISNETV